MRHTVSLFASLSLVAGVHAFATDPPAPSTTPQGQQAAPAQSSSTAEAAPSTAAPATPATSTPAAPTTAAATQQPASNVTVTGSKPTDLTPQEKNLISSGYTLEIRKDQKLFCKSEASLGTRFKHKTCQTSDQIFATTQHSKDATSDIQRGYAPPPAGH